MSPETRAELSRKAFYPLANKPKCQQPEQQVYVCSGHFLSVRDTAGLCQAWSMTSEEQPRPCRPGGGRDSFVCSVLGWAHARWPGPGRGSSGAGTERREQSVGPCDVVWPGTDLAGSAHPLCFFLSTGVPRGRQVGAGWAAGRLGVQVGGGGLAQGVTRGCSQQQECTNPREGRPLAFRPNSRLFGDRLAPASQPHSGGLFWATPSICPLDHSWHLLPGS